MNRDIPAVYVSRSGEGCGSSYPPRHKQGLTIFFSGLSGSGKSTIANVLLTSSWKWASVTFLTATWCASIFRQLGSQRASRH
jgi:ABC-type glutathione transport system ATPase component